MVALTVYTSAFICEVVRSGINTVPLGQAEAARALGLTFGQSLSQIILPQALRSVVPPLVSTLIALLKNTTIAAGFSVAEAGRIRSILSDDGENQLVGLLWVALGFVILVMVLTLVQRDSREAVERGPMSNVALRRRPGPGPASGTACSPCIGGLVLARRRSPIVVLAVLRQRPVRRPQVGVAPVQEDPGGPAPRLLATLQAFAARRGAGAGCSVRSSRPAGCPSTSRCGWCPAFVVELFRAIPLLILMFVFYYGLPTVGVKMSPYMAVVLGLMLYNGSVLAEVFRAGIQALPRGQTEAAYALGMRKTQVMVLILLPQALRSMLPTIISQLVVLLKDTALGFLITYEELLRFAQHIGGEALFGRPFVPTALVVAAIYIGHVPAADLARQLPAEAGAAQQEAHRPGGRRREEGAGGRHPRREDEWELIFCRPPGRRTTGWRPLRGPRPRRAGGQAGGTGHAGAVRVGGGRAGARRGLWHRHGHRPPARARGAGVRCGPVAGHARGRQEVVAGVDFEVGSMLALPHADAAFGGVSAWYSTIHVPDDLLPTALAELARVLRPGGHLLLGFQVGDEPMHMTSALDRHDIELVFHRRRPDRMAALLAAAGVPVEVTTVRERLKDERTAHAFLIARKPA